MTIIITSRRRNCWKWGETGHLSSSCPKKKASCVLLPANTISPMVESVVYVSPVIGMPVNGIGVVKPVVVSVSLHSFLEKTFFSTACAFAEKE